MGETASRTIPNGQAAVEFVASVQVPSGQISYHQLRGSNASKLVQTPTASRADGLVVDEEIVSSRMLPPGRREATEALIVAALRGDRSLDGLLPVPGQTFHAADSEGPGQLLADLPSPLMELRADKWSFDQAVHKVLTC